MDIAPILEALEVEATPLIRTDFTDAALWRKVVTEATTPLQLEPVEGDDNDDDGAGSYDLAANLRVIDDPRADGIGPEDLARLLEPCAHARGYAILVDQLSIAAAAQGEEISVVYVDLAASAEMVAAGDSYRGNSFRCAVNQVVVVETNLSIGNLFFHEFAEDLEGGVFRG